MKRLVLVGAVVLAMHVTGCSDVPMAPQTTPRFSTADVEIAKLAKYKNGRKSLQTFAMESIGPAGGTVTLGDFEIVIPPGALLEQTSITITLPTDAKRANYVLAEFGPHGIQFAVPVSIRLPHTGTSAEEDVSVHVLWNNGFQWTPLPSSMTEDGRVQAETDHFSEYGTEETSRGITLAGG